MNITAISDKTGLNHVRLVSHLEELIDLRIIQEKKFGRIKIYELNQESHVAIFIKEFFSEWEERSSDQINRFKGEVL